MQRVTFDADYFPAAPVLVIRLAYPASSKTTLPAQALLDTGSDFSMAPLSMLVEIDAPEKRAAKVRGLFSAGKAVYIYQVDLHLETGILPAVEFIGIDDQSGNLDSKEIILGRNVLNRLLLLLDGPQQQTYVLEQLPRRF